MLPVILTGTWLSIKKNPKVDDKRISQQTSTIWEQLMKDDDLYWEFERDQKPVDGRLEITLPVTRKRRTWWNKQEKEKRHLAVLVPFEGEEWKSSFISSVKNLFNVCYYCLRKSTKHFLIHFNLNCRLNISFFHLLPAHMKESKNFEFSKFSISFV